MTSKRIWATLSLLLIACVAIMAVADVAHAQTGANDSKGAKISDKKVATRTGVGGALADGPADTSDGPSAIQMGIGVGSIFVMIAVVKWL